MRALLLVVAAFVGGLLLGASSYRARSALADLRALLPGPLAPVWAPQCSNIYKGGHSATLHRLLPPPPAAAAAAADVWQASSGAILPPPAAPHFCIEILP